VEAIRQDGKEDSQDDERYQHDLVLLAQVRHRTSAYIFRYLFHALSPF